MRVILTMLVLVLSAMGHTAIASETHVMTMGNGQNNWIITQGISRSGATFTVPEAKIDRNGWLVIHQVVNGKPVGEKYLGATYIAAGVNKNVVVTVDYTPQSGETFLIMLHSDVNENKVFDFVFVDPPNVLDKAVFEADRMIALIFTAP